jgi:histidinol-phosphate aminotransferase
MKATEGLLNNCLRVTVGKPEENEAFLTALRNAVKSEK